MRKIILITLLSTIVASPYIIMDNTSEYNALRIKYPRLQQDWYSCMFTECAKYTDNNHKAIPVADICAIIQNEGEWNPYVMHKNTHMVKGVLCVSYDYGLMQLNSVHEKFHEDLMVKYLNPMLNLKKGIYEYNQCLITANYDKAAANRLYNAGRNNKASEYHNWPYVEAIARDRTTVQEILNNFYKIK